MVVEVGVFVVLFVSGGGIYSIESCVMDVWGCVLVLCVVVWMGLVGMLGRVYIVFCWE